MAGFNPSRRAMQYPLWVKSRHMQCKKACPLYPQERTCAVQLWMSALGQQGTWPMLFDHLIGSIQQAKRHGETQRFGRLQVIHELESCRLHNR
jgi:hypothetical protein